MLTAAAMAVGVTMGALLSPLLTSESSFGVGQAMGLEAAEVVAGGTTPLDAGSGNVAPALRKMSLSTGLYEIRPSKSKRLRLDVAGASLASGANVQLYRRNSSNCQKFAVVRVKGGAYRIGAAFSNNELTARSGKKKAHTNVLMMPWRGSSSQLWIPFKLGSGIVFKNKKSGKLLSFKSARSGANVRQAPAGASSATTLWKVVATKANAGDEASLRNAIDLASGSGLRASNQIAGHKVSAKRWKRLVSAVNSCKSHGISLGFVMVDCKTGFTVGCGANRVRFGASTVKGLYVTYLFEEYLEKGRLSVRSISGLAHRAIVWSDNDAYRALRARYGSERGFRAWIARSGMPRGSGYSGGLWGNYSARQLARGWTHAAGYLSSGGKHVKAWKRLFNRSDHSFIREALGKSRSTYTKPGWMFGGTWSGTIMNDAGIADDGHGRRYLLAFSSNANPDSRYRIGRVVKALDAIDHALPKTRAK